MAGQRQTWAMIATPAVVAIAFNRPGSLRRLLGSVGAAEYPDGVGVPLIISIDGGGDAETLAVADRFEWLHGEKHVIRHGRHLGLRQHVLQCGDLALDHGSVVLLEDDLVVSPVFYGYAREALGAYAQEDVVAGVSLYAQRFNETAQCPFEPVNNGYSTFFARMPSSWGQAFDGRQWSEFRDWLGSAAGSPDLPGIPERVRNWPDSSWKKLSCCYTESSGRWFVYPYVGYTTNFGDLGSHTRRRSAILQTELAIEHQRLLFAPRDRAVKYDLFWELAEHPIDAELGVVWDVYGTKPDPEAPYVVSSRRLPGYRPIRGYGLDLRPVQLNYYLDNPGTAFWLQERVGVAGRGWVSKGAARFDRGSLARRIAGVRADWLPARVLFGLLWVRIADWVKRKASSLTSTGRRAADD